MLSRFFLLIFITNPAYASNTIERFFNVNPSGQAIGAVLEVAGIYYFCKGFIQLWKVYEGTLQSTKTRCAVMSLGGIVLFYHVSFLSIIFNTLGINF